jgi:hypothetical protein
LVTSDNEIPEGVPRDAFSILKKRAAEEERACDGFVGTSPKYLPDFNYYQLVSSYTSKSPKSVLPERGQDRACKKTAGTLVLYTLPRFSTSP